jgi:ParB family chromosome partitioning protein
MRSPNTKSRPHRRERFVTLAAYEQAGGGVRRDLLCDDDSGVFILDVDILDRLAGEKLEADAGAVRAEGWKMGREAPQSPRCI